MIILWTSVALSAIVFIQCSKDSENLCMEYSKRFNLTELEAVNTAITEWHQILPFLLSKEKADVYDMKRDGYSRGQRRGHEFNYLGPIGPTCLTPWNSYGTGDEEKRICGTLKSAPTRNCTVYSIGSNNNFGWEEDVANRTNCFIEIFDCTVDEFKPPVFLLPRIRTHKICLGDKDEVVNGKKFLNWFSLNKLTGIKGNPDFLKMDIEGFEYPVFQSIINSGVNYPLQIAFELHIGDVMHRGSVGYQGARNVFLAETIAFMEYLRVFGGYYLVNRRDNDIVQHCTEIVVAKLRCKDHSTMDPKLKALRQFSQGHDLLRKQIQDYVAESG